MLLRVARYAGPMRALRCGRPTCTGVSLWLWVVAWGRRKQGGRGRKLLLPSVPEALTRQRVRRAVDGDEIVVHEVQSVHDWPYFGASDTIRRCVCWLHDASPLRCCAGMRSVCAPPPHTCVAECRDSPLVGRREPGTFTGVGETLISAQVLRRHPDALRAPRGEFLVAGPYENVSWDPNEVRAAIVTCGGLCPGLNTVVRELVMCLTYSYGVKVIYGVPNGYRGMYENEYIRLTPQLVSSIHLRGGTILGSSRGGFNLDRMLDGAARHGVNQLYVIGGDGTHRGAQSIAKGVYFSWRWPCGRFCF